MKHKTLKAAQKEAKKNTEKFLKTNFCPMIKGFCREECVCFVPAQAIGIPLHAVKEYGINNAYCANASFFGSQD